MKQLAAAFFIVIFALRSAAAGLEDQFAAANQAYEQGRYADAAAAYESIITRGAPTAAAWFNLGDARFKMGDLGRAIAAWRQAERITPRDAALRANLQFARKKAAGDSDPLVPLKLTVLRFFSLNEWIGAASAAIALLFLALAVLELRSKPAPRPRGLLIALGILAGVLSLGAALSWTDRTRPEGVFLRSAAVRFGPLDDAQAAFQLGAGAEVYISDSTPSWAEIRTSDGRSGWVNRDVVIGIVKSSTQLH